MSPMTQESSIAAELRDDILRGRYRSGERLPSERDLAERFGVHRSTVRGAVKHLEQLGIADVRPGGARVCPIEEASLDVLEHMLALQEPPDPELLDQTLEAMSGFLAHAARLGTERSSGEQQQQLLSILDEMIKSGCSGPRRGELFAALSEGLSSASGNPVLKLMRNGLRTRYSDYVLPNPAAMSVPSEAIEPFLIRLREAIESRSGAEASDALYHATTLIRGAIRSALEADPARNASAGAVR